METPPGTIRPATTRLMEPPENPPDRRKTNTTHPLRARDYLHRRGKSNRVCRHHREAVVRRQTRDIRTRAVEEGIWHTGGGQTPNQTTRSPDEHHRCHNQTRADESTQTSSCYPKPAKSWRSHRTTAPSAFFQRWARSLNESSEPESKSTQKHSASYQERSSSSERTTWQNSKYYH